MHFTLNHVVNFVKKNCNCFWFGPTSILNQPQSLTGSCLTFILMKQHWSSSGKSFPPEHDTPEFLWHGSFDWADLLHLFDRLWQFMMILSLWAAYNSASISPNVILNLNVTFEEGLRRTWLEWEPGLHRIIPCLQLYTVKC